MQAPAAAMRARWAAGRVYAASWRRAEDVLERVAPASAREARRLPRLPAEPFAPKYGLRLGRPVDRVYIERFLESHAADIRGEVLELLDRVYTERFGGDRVSRSDILDASPTSAEATVRGNLETGEGLPGDSYDCFICTQTLSLIFDVRAAVANAYSLLRPGGTFLVTVPGISQQADPEHEEFPDYWRFTKLCLARLLSDAFGPAHVNVEAYGTVAASAAFVYGVPADHIDRQVLDPHDPDYEMVVCGRAQRVG
jgi:SAM-dependent methyltransferase